jgi:hypothetical protein
MRKKRKLLVGLTLLGAIACGVGIGTMHFGSDEPSSEVITEHRPLGGGAPTRRVGEDCTLYGGSACLSGLCLHAKPTRNQGYFCTIRCSAQRDCPVGWQCPQIYPGPQGHICVPPSNWIAEIALLPDGGVR